MTIPSTTDTTALGGTPPKSPASSSSQDAPSADMFLKLLVAQLRTQNPLEPQKGTEFVTQLAQFNSLEQLMAIRAELRALRQATEAGQTPNGSSSPPSDGGPAAIPTT